MFRTIKNKPFMKISFATLVSALLLTFSANAQYVVNGNADSISCNCYRLTQAINTQSGSVWNSNMISLTDPFDFSFDVYLGSNNGGADGIAFVLQPISTAAGSTGGGMGYEGIDPSLAVEIDTYQNGWDPVNDHIAIQYAGNVDHNSAFNLAGPADALNGGANIEDALWHLLRVDWDPTSLTLDVYMDGSLRVSYTGDIVANVFSSDPMVFWGFTGSTGGLNNEHQFCLSIQPSATLSANSICEEESIVFSDDSYSSLGEVVSWDWDFGNGTTSTDENPGAVQFNDAGIYDIVQTIVDAAGCDASESFQITVHPNPQTDFVATAVCLGEETEFTSESTVQSGTITEWLWDLGDGTDGSGNALSHVYGAAGSYLVSLQIETDQGCIDSLVEVQVEVFSEPNADFTYVATSLDVVFSTELTTTEDAQWIILDTAYTGVVPFNYSFPDSGWYDVTLVVTNTNGCLDSVTYAIYVEGIPEYEVPNVFTPNGDDFNERFQPYTYAIIEANMKVFNRWGRPVYKYEGLVPPVDPWGWDGTVNGGANAATGTYYYILDLKSTNGTNFSEHGTVTLLR
jgi:gliding motility-associated-like protein